MGERSNNGMEQQSSVQLGLAQQRSCCDGAIRHLMCTLAVTKSSNGTNETSKTKFAYAGFLSSGISCYESLQEIVPLLMLNHKFVSVIWGFQICSLFRWRSHRVYHWLSAGLSRPAAIHSKLFWANSRMELLYGIQLKQTILALRLK